MSSDKPSIAELKKRLMDLVDALKETEKTVSSEVDDTAADSHERQGRADRIVGVDIGTSRIVSLVQKADGDISGDLDLNGFVRVPHSEVTLQMLKKNNMKYQLSGADIAVLGYGAQEFAALMNGEMQRPMKVGLLTPDEAEAVPMIRAIIRSLVRQTSNPEDTLCFSIPAPRQGYESELIYHRAIFQKLFTAMGYNTMSISEGMAVVLSELAKENYTGIGISMGAGMCNICFSFLSVPVLVYSIPKGGDDIDISVSRVTNESISRVRLYKENSLDLERAPVNKIEEALHIFYEDLILMLLKGIAHVFMQAQTEHLPKLNRALSVVIAGGTSMPKGFMMRFERMLKQINLSIEIANVRLARDPLRATARGCLIRAGVGD
ncbi:MAG: hypothetical protein HQM16_14045 [Deltaproteobacteria bacterium]|nr:hypothetical protein [Deltaproteobacteria bacterium]